MLEILNKLNHYSVEQPDMIALSFRRCIDISRTLYSNTAIKISLHAFTERVPSRIVK